MANLFPVLQSVSEVPTCAGCPMARLFPQSKFVPAKIGTGNRLVIAEAPGEEEALQGEALVGTAGKWFDGMIRKAGIQREALTLSNTICCRPPSNVYPTDIAARSYISQEDAEKAVAQCSKNHLWPLVHGREWTRIDALGDKALQELTGKKGIFEWRGSALPLKGEVKPRVVPTLHPAYIARDQSMITVVVNDLRKGVVTPPENYNLTPTLEDLRAFEATDFAFDLETKWGTQEITLVGICASSGKTIVVPFKGMYVPELKRIFANAIRVYAHNGVQFDVPILANAGIKLSDECEVVDTMLAQHLLFPDLPHDLEFVASQFTAKPAWKSEGRGLPGYWELRNARDADVTLAIGKVLVPMLKKDGLWDLYNYVQVPLARICKVMNETGFKVDPNRLNEVRERLLAQIAEEEVKLPETLRGYDKPKRIRKPAPEGTVNEKGKPVKFVYEATTERISPWRSSKALSTYLYQELGLPHQLHPKSKKITTDKSAVEKCAKVLRRQNRPVEASALQGYLKLKKAATLISSFCTEEMASHAVARIHPHFNVHGTSSGRLSSSDPNLQNQPETARYIYVPSHAEWSIVAADFSNIEPRLTAYFSGDETRLQRFAQPGYNEHKWTTSQFFDIPYEEVVKDNDRDAPYGKAKRINNGLNYGMGVQKIVNTFDLDFKEVKEMVFKWKQFNAKTAQWQEETTAQAKSDGELTTPFGRKRWFYTSSYFTESLSFLPQSSAADVIFKAMIGLYFERIGWSREKAIKVCPNAIPLPRPARMLLSVHDELVFETPNSILDEVVSTITYVMESPIAELGGMAFPIAVNVGPSWGECEKYHPPQIVLPAALAA